MSNRYGNLIISQKTPERKRRQQTVGKRRDPNYQQLGPYVSKPLYHAVRAKVAQEDVELSDVVEQLLQGWIDGRIEVELSD